MKHTSSPIVFFGSGPVAKASLDFLAQHFQIEAIVTKPITEQEMTAGLADIPVYTVTNRHELDTLIADKPFKSQLGIIVDFGIIVSREVIDYFPLGIINAHFSLLPLWRGADPISFALLSGEPETGVSLMLINEALDEGALLAQENLLIDAAATGESLTHDLVALSNDMLQRYVPLYQNGKLKPYPQDTTTPATYSRKLTKEDGRLDWTKPAAQLDREIRTFKTWPKSTTTLAGMEVVITKARPLLPDEITSVADNAPTKPGSVLTDGKKNLAIITSDGALAIEELKPAGKGAMTAAAFLAGYKNRLLEQQ